MLLFLVVWGKSPLLTGLAELWVRDEPLAKADVLVVLGGGVNFRPFAAARLYREGWAPKVVATNVKTTHSEKLKLTPSETELCHRVLLEKGVPENALEFVGSEVSSTQEEAVAVADWAKTHGVKTLVVPTELFHTRRVGWCLARQLRGSGIAVKTRAIRTPEYAVDNWWKSEQGLIAFQNEVVKQIFYWLKY